MAPTQPDLEAAEVAVQMEEAAPVSRLTRIRVLAFAAIGPLITAYAAVAAVLALITAVAPLAHFSTAGVLAAALPSWLAANQVPVGIGGAELGALPLLPTIGVMMLAARAAAGAAERLGLTSPREAGQVVGSFAVAHGVCGLLVALLHPGRFVDVDPLAAFYYPGLLAALAATAGVLRRCGLVRALVARADEVAVRGLAAGVVAVVSLLAAGAAVFTFGLVTSVATARDLFVASAPGVGSGIGMLLLCLGYLPNAVVAGTAFVAGPGFAMGEVSFSPLGFSGGRVPGLPLLAALPEEQAGWWPALCLLPLVVGVVVGRRLRYVAESPLSRVRAVAVAAGVVAVAFVLLAGSAGGRLGAGAFDPVTMRAAAVSLALVLAVGGPAAVVAWFGGPRPHGDPAPGLIPDYEPEDEPAGEADAESERGPDDGPAGEPGAESESEADAESERGPDDGPAGEPEAESERGLDGGRAGEPKAESGRVPGAAPVAEPEEAQGEPGPPDGSDPAKAGDRTGPAAG